MDQNFILRRNTLNTTMFIVPWNSIVCKHLEHFLIKYHEQSTFLIIDCSEILTNYFLIYHNANMGGGGEYALIYIFSIIWKM